MVQTQEVVQRDRFSKNVVFESISRTLALVGGVVSSVILWRAIRFGFWSIDEYAVVRILSNANAILLPLALLGINGAIVRVIPEYITDRLKIGRTIGFSVLVSTVTSLAVILLSTLLMLDVLLLQDALEEGLTLEALRFYWVIILITILPTAYLRMARAAFWGVQRVRYAVYIDIVYNLIRTGSLIALFIYGGISILSVLALNLVLAVICAAYGLGVLASLMRENSIPWGFNPGREIIAKIVRVSLVGLVGTIAVANLNNATTIWISPAGYGTNEDVGYYSIAQSVSETVRTLAAAPLVVLGPNLALEYGIGRRDEIRRKFRESSRALLPLSAFLFATVFVFAEPILRVLYGADSVPSAYYLRVMSFEQMAVVIPGLYYNLFFSVDDVRGMVYSSLTQILFQTLWIVTLAPLIGVVAIPLVWISYLAHFALMHVYSRRKHEIVVDQKSVIGSMVLGVGFTLIMWILVTIVGALARDLPVPDVVIAGGTCMLLIPLWYAYMYLAIRTRVLGPTELKNFASVIRVIPPVWWMSKGLIVRLEAIVPSGDLQDSSPGEPRAESDHRHD